MKTKELIRQLQEADPTGEEECCVGNLDIMDVHVEPAYYDGCLQVLIRDETRKHEYNVTGAKYVGTGIKICISPYAISDMLFDFENMPIFYEGLSESQQSYYQKLTEERRNQARKIHDDVNRLSFVQYMKKRLAGHCDFEEEEVEMAAIDFYNGNLSYLDEIPLDIHEMWKPKVVDGQNIAGNSLIDRRCLMWDRQLTVEYVDGTLVIKKISDVVAP